MANPVGAAVRNTYAAAVGGGWGDRNVPEIAEFVARANGERLHGAPDAVAPEGKK